jgi:hypothetical protein
LKEEKQLLESIKKLKEEVSRKDVAIKHFK